MPTAQFTLDDLRVKVLPIDSGYCRERWRLYRKWELALKRAEQDGPNAGRLSYRAMVDHMRGCQICRDHAARMDALASRAVYPEVKLPDWY